MKKRLFSLLMAMVMLLTFSAVAVSADDAVIEDVPAEEIPVGTGITISKPNLPEYYVTTKVANNFPAEAGTMIATTPETYDPGVAVNPDEYAIATGDFTAQVSVGSAEITYQEDTGKTDLLRLLIKTMSNPGANYLTFHIDTTNLSGSAYFCLYLKNPWSFAYLKEGYNYYFQPDATEENPNPKRETFVIGDTTFEGFKIPAGVTGTIYLPENAFYKVVDGEKVDIDFDVYIEPWSMTDVNRQNCSIYLENKMEYDGGAVVGDTIVFSNMLWVKEEASSLGYNAEYLSNDFTYSENGNYTFTTINSGNGWANWYNIDIGAPFNESFDAIKFDLDYSEFTGSERYIRLWYYYNRVVDGNLVPHHYRVTGTFYAIWEDGKVQNIEVNTGWDNGTASIPLGFKGTIIIPFSSFTDTAGDGMMFWSDVDSSKIQIQLYAPIDTILNGSIDNMGYLTNYKATDLVSARAQLMNEAFEEPEKTVDLNGNGVLDAVDIVYLKKIVAWAA